MAEDERFRPVEGLPGRVYIPVRRGTAKHPCPECYVCQWCPGTRCAACRHGADSPAPLPRAEEEPGAGP